MEDVVLDIRESGEGRRVFSPDPALGITDLQTRPRRRRKEARAAACTLDETIQF
jgi:hypothetical protein